MSRYLHLCLITLIIIILNTPLLMASSSVTYRISVTIPAIAGFNTPALSERSFEKEDFDHISEELWRNDQRITLITIVPK